MYKAFIRYPKQFLPKFRQGSVITIDDIQFTVSEYRELPKNSSGYKNYNLAGILFMESHNHAIKVITKVKLGKRDVSFYFDNPILQQC